MYIKLTALVVVALLLNLTCPGRALAGTNPEKMKTEIAKLGTGPDARVEIKLRDKTKLKGYISEAGDQSFAIVEKKTGSTRTVAYDQVKQVKGNNLSTGAAIAIGVGIGIGVIVLIAFIGTRLAE